jgi:hypothetical protein
MRSTIQSLASHLQLAFFFFILLHFPLHAVEPNTNLISNPEIVALVAGYDPDAEVFSLILTSAQRFDTESFSRTSPF